MLSKVKEPDTFTGKEAKWEEFQQQVRLKLNTFTAIGPSEPDRINYVVSLLRDDAQRRAYTRMGTDGAFDYATAEDLLKYLGQAYGDPDRHFTARGNIQSMRQGLKEPFHTFFARWNSELAYVGNNWYGHDQLRHA